MIEAHCWGGPTISAESAQDFGDNPVEVRDTEHYTEEYVPGFVEKWDALIDWDKRAESEGSFFIDLLRKRGAKSVLDVAAGTGFHSVRLMEAGFEVVSADGSADMLAQAFENGREYGDYVLRVVQADWRWLNRDVHGEYDAIICLGNAFTHLFSERDRRKTLAEFYAMLKHDGVLILDQRNYDSILDEGYSSKHAYYYCGDGVVVEPDHVDDGLCRMKYTFQDKSEYFLNMYPLRKEYTRRLMYEVGFQRVETYGDFQSDFREGEPDFYIHVAEKAYLMEDEVAEPEYEGAVATARDYYNSHDADTFYFTVWGGEDIHVGLYESDDEDIASASKRTVEQMAGKVDLSEDSVVLDLGAGYGGSARYLASTYGCKVVALNLSEVENQRDREMNAERGLADKIEVIDASFEEIPYPDNSFDVVWSQDAFLHSGERAKVLDEVSRVLKPGGQIIFTDPMATDDADRAALQPILERIHLETLGSPGWYADELTTRGFQPASGTGYEDHRQQLPAHYGRVLAELERHESEGNTASISEDYISRMKKGLQHWVDGGNSGNLAWGIFHYRQ